MVMDKIRYSIAILIFKAASVYGAISITSINPGGVILAGGIQMTVDGVELDTATSPDILISGSYTSGGTTVTRQYSGLTCAVVNASQLLCESPVVALADFTTAGYTAPTNANIRLISTTELTFVIGLTGTGNPTLESFASISVYKNPEPILENSQRAYTVWTNKIASIDGHDLDKFITNITDYDISVSNDTCEMQFVNSTYMWCVLPHMPPYPNHPDGVRVNVDLKIGYYNITLGTLWYRIPIFSNPSTSVQEYFPRFPDSFIIINGTELTYGLSPTLYKIQIGDQECVYIELLDTQIKCRGPDLQPTQLSTYPTISDYPQIVITVPRNTIHHQYIHHVGHVKYNYLEPVYETTASGTGVNSSGTNETDWGGFWRWMLLGIAFFIGVSSCCCLCCCIICAKCCRRRRTREEDEPPLQRSSSANSSYRSYIMKAAPASSYWSYVTKETEQKEGPSRYFHVTEERYSPKRHYVNRGGASDSM